MTGLGKAAIGLGLAIAVGAVIYPNIHASLVRQRATSRLEQAGALAQQMTSPVAKTSLDDAIQALQLALRSGGTTSASIAESDAALATLMDSLKTSPPPDHPVTAELVYEPVAAPGQTFSVTVNVRAAVAAAFLVRIVAQIELDSGWKSDEVRRDLGQPITQQGAAGVRVEFPVPKDASGPGHVRATVVYRLNTSGEGRDFQESAQGTVTVKK